MTRTPVVLIHGAWLHLSCWDAWAARFTAHGYAVSVPAWPGEPDKAATARQNPEPMRDTGLNQLRSHFTRLIQRMDRPPVLIGHGIGGLIAQHLLSLGLAEAAVAIAPMPIPGVPSVDLHVRPSLAAQIWGEPVGHNGFVPLSRPLFRYAVANAVGEEEAVKLYARYSMPTPTRLVSDTWTWTPTPTPTQTSTFTFTPSPTPTPVPLPVDTDNPTRGPLLLISGQEDLLVPDAATRSVYKLYGDSTAVTDLKQFADRGHSLIMDSGWHGVADYTLAWLAGNDLRPTDGHKRFM
ncbi:MAG: alpha/beta hydrolase [Catenulispora sp.]|nr:alpha/beta hydrolase [Catenulispora sp.]